MFPDGSVGGDAYASSRSKGSGARPRSHPNRRYCGSAWSRRPWTMSISVRAEKEAARRAEEAAHHSGEGAEVSPQHRRPRLRFQKRTTPSAFCRKGPGGPPWSSSGAARSRTSIWARSCFPLRFAADLVQYGTIEGQLRLEGRNAHVLFSPVKAAVAHPTKDGGQGIPQPKITHPKIRPPAIGQGARLLRRIRKSPSPSNKNGGLPFRLSPPKFARSSIGLRVILIVLLPTREFHAGQGAKAPGAQ